MKGIVIMERVGTRYSKLVLLSLLILCLGVGVGCIYLMNTSGENVSYIKEYLTLFFDGFGENIKKNQIFKNAFIQNLLLALFIFISGFFKICTPVVAFCVARKGFIMGFTSASVLRSFGIKGLIINMAYLPTIIVSIPAFLFFASISVKNACADIEDKRRNLFVYLFVAFIIAVLLSISALFEAYITTSFMNFMAHKL